MRPYITVIVPCYNEEDTIVPILNKIRDVPVSKEIIVVCDGSTDGTAALLEHEQKKYDAENFKVFYHERNMGKGAAVRTALAVARGEIVIIQDSDMELDPGDYPKLLKPFRDGADVVFGSRFKENPPKVPYYSKFANFCVTFLANFLYGAGISDEACGYKIMRLELYRSLNLRSDGFDFCPEVTAKVRRKGYRIVDVPVRFNPRTFNEGKKIHWYDGFRAVWVLVKLRFAPV